MADSIKISELPELVGVDPDDIVPVVDKTMSQTSRVTAGTIAALGGGPPGAGMVVTSSLANDAVTFAKMQNLSANVVIGRTGSSGDPEQITCTPFARTLLDDADQATALTTLGFSGPTFTEPVKGAAGTAALPSYTFTGDLDTGMYSPAANTIGFTTFGLARLTIDGAGVWRTNLAGTWPLYNAYFCRAMMHFNGDPSPPTAYANGNHGFSAVARVAGQAAGVYELTFSAAMPDTDYIPAVTCNIPAAVINVLNKTTTGFRIQLREWNFNGGSPLWGYSNTDSINVAIFR